jgi:hypothetical protein
MPRNKPTTTYTPRVKPTTEYSVNRWWIVTEYGSERNESLLLLADWQQLLTADSQRLLLAWGQGTNIIETLWN